MPNVYMNDTPVVQTVGAGGIGVEPPVPVEDVEKISETGREMFGVKGKANVLPNPASVSDGNIMLAGNGVWGAGEAPSDAGLFAVIAYPVFDEEAVNTVVSYELNKTPEEIFSTLDNGVIPQIFVAYEPGGATCCLIPTSIQLDSYTEAGRVLFVYPIVGAFYQTDLVGFYIYEDYERAGADAPVEVLQNLPPMIVPFANNDSLDGNVEFVVPMRNADSGTLSLNTVNDVWSLGSMLSSALQQVILAAYASGSVTVKQSVTYNDDAEFVNNSDSLVKRCLICMRNGRNSVVKFYVDGYGDYTTELSSVFEGERSAGNLSRSSITVPLSFDDGSNSGVGTVYSGYITLTVLYDEDEAAAQVDTVIHLDKHEVASP